MGVAERYVARKKEGQKLGVAERYEARQLSSGTPNDVKKITTALGNFEKSVVTTNKDSITKNDINNISKVASGLKSSAALDGLFVDEKTAKSSKKDYEKQLKEIKKKKLAKNQELIAYMRARDEGKTKTIQKELNEINKQYKDIQNQYNTTNKYIKDLETDKKSYYYSTIPSEYDFISTSNKGAKIDNSDETHQYINSTSGKLKIDKLSKVAAPNSMLTSKKIKDDFDYLDKLTEAQKQVYNYLYAKEGKESANEYLNIIRPELEYAKSADEYNNLKDKSAISQLLYSVPTGLDQFTSGVSTLMGDEYQGPSSTAITAARLKENRGSAFNLAFDTGTAISNMAPSIAVSAATGSPLVGTGLFTASATGNYYKEALSLGYDKEQARNYALLSGASEGGLQYFLGGIGKLGGSVSGKLFSNSIKNIDSTFLRVSATLGKNAISEGTEEYLQDVLNPLFKNIALGENNKITLLSKDALYSGVVGALTAGLLDGGGTIINSTQYAKKGKELIDNNQDGSLIDYALTLSPNTEAYKTAKGIKDGKINKNAYNIGELFAKANYEIIQTKQEIGREKQTKTKNETIARVGIALDGLNVEDKNVRKSFTKVISGEDISASEVEAIKKDKNVSSLMSEITGVNLEEKASSAEIAKAINNATISFNYEASTAAQESTQDVSISNETNVISDTQAMPQTSTQSVSATPQDVKVVSEKYTPNVAKTFVGIYDGKIPLNEFSDMFDMLYRAGRAGLTFEKAVEANPLLVETFGRHNAFAALNAGIASKKETEEFSQKAVDRNVKSSKEGGVYRDNNVRLDELNRAQFKVLDSVGKKYGVVFVVKEGLAHDANGMYHGGTNVIEISLNAEKDGYLVAAGHELVHYIKNKNEADYKALESFVVNKLSESYNMESLVSQRVAMYKEQGADITRTAALEEIVANSCFDVLSNEKAINELATENKSLLNKIAEWFKDFIGELKGIVSRLSSEEARALRNDIESLEKINELFYKALEGAKENTTTKSDGEVKFSINDKYVSDIQEWYSNGSLTDERFILGSTSDVIQGLGARENDIYMNGDKIKKILKKHPEMTITEIKKIPQVLENPVIVLKSKNNVKKNSRLVLFGTVKAQNGKPALCILDLMPIENKLYIDDMQKTISAYTKTNPANDIKKFFEESEVLYTTKNKKVATNLLTRVGFSMPTDLLISGYIGSITYGNENVNIKGVPFNKVFKYDDTTNNSISKNPANSVEILKEDVKFSLKHTDVEVDDAQELLRENADLRKAVEILKQEFKLTQGHNVKRSSVENMANKYIKGYNSKVDINELTNRLESTFNNISNAEALDWDSVFIPLLDIAKDVVSNSETLNTELYDMYKDLRDELRTTRISLSDNVKNELAYHYGSYNNFRRSNFGKLNFTNDGIPLDDYFGELAEKYTDLFDEDTHELEQPMRLAEVLNSIQPYYENEYGANIDEVSAVLALEMYEDYFAIPEVKTYADKQNEKLVKMQSSYRNRIDDMKRGMRNRYEAKYEQLKKEYEERNKKKISKKDEQLLKQKAKYEERIAYNRRVFDERNELDRYRKKVIKNLNDLSKWLFKGTDKQHVPEKFRTAVASALSLTDTSSVGNHDTIRSFKFAELRSACIKITDDNYLDIDPDLEADIEELKNLVGDKQYLLMNSTELKMLNSILDRIRIAVVNANKLLANENYQTITDLANVMFEEFSGRKTRQVSAYKTIHAIDQKISFDSIDPVRFFDMMGEKSGGSIWHELRNGLNDKIAKTKAIKAYMDDVLNDTDISNWTGDKAIIHTFKLDSGEELRLSTAQVMGLYELNKREQARGHIYGGGILQSDTITGKVKKQISKSYSPLKVAPQDVGNILSVLTDEQRRVADKMTEFMNTTAADWGNEVSMKMYGYRKFTEKNYYPIRVSENQVNSDTTNEANTLYTLKNVGFTKQTLDKANNALMIDDIFDVFTKHADNMASYSAFVIPLTDITKFYNYKYKDNDGLISSTAKQEMERVLGKDGKQYLYNLLVDMNGAHKKVIGEEGGQRRLSKFKSAAVGANLRVAVQQPMSIARAFDMMNPIDFTHIKPRKGLQETMEKYAPIVTWKNYGFYELDVGKSMKEIFIGKKTFNDYAMWLNAKGDAVAWEVIWLAVENEVKRTSKGLEVGSEEFYKEVGNRFSDVIDRTQVVDSILHRTQVMRSKNLYLKMTTSFMAEPLKSYNMMYHAIYNVKVNPTKENKARLARTTFVFVLNQFLVSAAASAVSALIGDDDDKTYWERFLKEMLGVDSNNETVLDQIKSTLFSSFAGGLNPLNLLPVARDVMSMLEGWSVERADMTGFSQIVNTMNQFEKYFTDDDYKYDEAYLLENAVRGLSTLSGIPVYNITKDLKRIANLSAGIAKSAGVDTSGFEYQLAKLKLEIESTKNKTYYANKILQAQLEGNEEVAKQIAEDMAKGGMSQDDISKAMESARGKYLDSNEKIIAYANSRLEGNDSAYIQAADEFKGDVFSQDDVVKSMNRIINKVKKGETVEAEEPFDSSKMFDYTQDSDKQLYSSDYETSDITSAVESGEDISKMVDDIVETKKKNGDTRTEAQMKSSIRSGVTRHFKEIYLSSSANERVEIERKLYRSGLYGSYSDIQDITKKWREEK